MITATLPLTIILKSGVRLGTSVDAYDHKLADRAEDFAFHKLDKLCDNIGVDVVENLTGVAVDMREVAAISHHPMVFNGKPDPDTEAFYIVWDLQKERGQRADTQFVGLYGSRYEAQQSVADESANRGYDVEHEITRIELTKNFGEQPLWYVLDTRDGGVDLQVFDNEADYDKAVLTETLGVFYGHLKDPAKDVILHSFK